MTDHETVDWLRAELQIARRVVGELEIANKRLQEELQDARSDSVSWEKQADDRVSDCVDFIERLRVAEPDARRYQFIRDSGMFDVRLNPVNARYVSSSFDRMVDFEMIKGGQKP